jgi:hypothetical protein
VLPTSKGITSLSILQIMPSSNIQPVQGSQGISSTCFEQEAISSKVSSQEIKTYI